MYPSDALSSWADLRSCKIKTLKISTREKKSAKIVDTIDMY
jgi:hypothetical protein